VNAAPLSRVLSFAAQIAGILAVIATALFGFAWVRTGSLDLAWPCLRGQRLVFLPPEIDCGVVPAGKIIDRHIRVVNLSSSPLTLTGAQQSCGCITLNEFPVVIGPGTEQRLDLKIGVSRKPGPFTESIKVFSDDQGSSSFVVQVTGLVE